MPDERERHIVPVGDLREHDIASDCWCGPQQDDECPWLFIHQSMDRREFYETGDLLPN